MELGYEIEFLKMGLWVRFMTTRFVLLTLLSILFVHTALARAPVWEVSKEGNTLYIGGTIHVLRTTDYPLPAAFEEAYEKADVLAFEADARKMSDPGVSALIMKRGAYPQGETLLDHLRPETVEKLKEYSAGLGMPYTFLVPMRPGLVLSMLSMLEIQKLGFSYKGVDETYLTQADADGKELLFLESLEEQIDFIAQLGLGNEDKLIAYTIESSQDISGMLEDMVSSWRDGDVSKLDKLLVQEMDAFRKIREDLLIGRNKAWIPSIRAWMETSEIEFVLVGAGHLVGEESVLELLEAEGFIVRQME
ncbi:MAG: TraB/GumN family protein [Opitutales bacterium]|nr:TraB/GumN family protein [Opitutales bacterium]